MFMVCETTWKPLDVEKMLNEMNFLWNSVIFTQKLRIIRKSIRILETKENERSGASKAVKVK